MSDKIAVVQLIDIFMLKNTQKVYAYYFSQLPTNAIYNKTLTNKGF